MVNVILVELKSIALFKELSGRKQDTKSRILKAPFSDYSFC